MEKAVEKVAEDIKIKLSEEMTQHIQMVLGLIDLPVNNEVSKDRDKIRDRTDWLLDNTDLTTPQAIEDAKESWLEDYILEKLREI